MAWLIDLRSLGVEAPIASGDSEAGHQPLDVPLERARQRLVEVIDAEDQLPVRGGEDTEVGQMRIPAQLHRQVGAGRARQVGGHQVRGAAIEGERRDQHSAVPDRDQLRHPTCGLLLKQANRVRPIRRRLPLPVHRQGNQFSHRLPPGGPLRHCGVFDLARLPGRGPIFGDCHVCGSHDAPICCHHTMAQHVYVLAHHPIQVKHLRGGRPPPHYHSFAKRPYSRIGLLRRHPRRGAEAAFVSHAVHGISPNEMIRHSLISGWIEPTQFPVTSSLSQPRT